MLDLSRLLIGFVDPALFRTMVPLNELPSSEKETWLSATEDVGLCDADKGDFMKVSIGRNEGELDSEWMYEIDDFCLEWEVDWRFMAFIRGGDWSVSKSDPLSENAFAICVEGVPVAAELASTLWESESDGTAQPEELTTEPDARCKGRGAGVDAPAIIATLVPSPTLDLRPC